MVEEEKGVVRRLSSYLRVCRGDLRGLFSQGIGIIRVLVVPLARVLVTVIYQTRVRSRWVPRAIDHGQVGAPLARGGLHGASLTLHGATPTAPHLEGGETLLDGVVFRQDMLLGLL